MRKKELTNWNIRVTRALDEAVEEAVRQDMHVSKSDLVRDAVRQLLKEIEAKESSSELIMKRRSET